MKVVITGSSGFIGFHASKKFLDEGFEVIGIDNENNYYDQELKRKRRDILENYNKNFRFERLDLSESLIIEKLEKISPDYIVNLAAQAGVRHSLQFPHDYTRSNIDSFLNLLEYAKTSKSLKHIVYASTSSVYGANNDLPFSESHGVDHPLQYYAVTKRTNELMAHSYSNLYGIRTTGLRFFTVYGPWGRPDMALFKFTKNILDNKKIELFNGGLHDRDFTYIDDIVAGIFSLIKKPPKSKIPYSIFNIGNGKPQKLLNYLKNIEKYLNKKAKIKKLPLQVGDIVKTHADIKKLKRYSKYSPKTNIEKGIMKFIEWYKEYYKID